MSMKNRRWVWLLLAAAMAVTACGGKAPAKPAQAAAETAAAGAAESAKPSSAAAAKSQAGESAAADSEKVETTVETTPEASSEEFKPRPVSPEAETMSDEERAALEDAMEPETAYSGEIESAALAGKADAAEAGNAGTVLAGKADAAEAGNAGAALAGNADTAQAGSGDAAEPASAAAPNTGGGKPWIDSDLKENIRKQMELSPREDFHLYVNHEWSRKYKIPAGYDSINSFLEAGDETKHRMFAVLKDEDLKGHDAKLVQAMYRAFMDWDARNAAGMEPVMKTVNALRDIKNMDELKAFLCDPERPEYVPCFADYGNILSLDKQDQYVFAVDLDAFSLKDAAEYKNLTEYGERCRDAGLYEAKALLSRVGYTEDQAEEMFRSMLDLEAQIAEVSGTSAEMMRPGYDLEHNFILTMDDVRELCPAYPLAEILEANGYGVAEGILIQQPDQFRRLNELFAEDNLEVIRDYLLIRSVGNAAEYLDREAYEVSAEASNMIKGASGLDEDDAVAVNQIRNLMQEPMTRAYMEKYDVTEMKARITEICEDVIRTYRVMLETEDWLSEETRAKAVEKLDHLGICAVCPDKWRDYSSLELEGLSYMECVEAAGKYLRKLDREKTNGESDRAYWNMDPMQINAFYSPYNNSMYICLGILGDPIYYEGMSDEALLGGIGSVIGHEISHAFDTNGAMFDKDGNPVNWWTDEDREAFRKRADRLVNYYNGITLWDGLNASGENVQTEAIADMGGLKVMLAIAKETEGFDYEVFFKTYATLWRRLNTREREYFCATQDAHPVHYLRTNVSVQQFQEFYDTFGVQLGDGMYLAPEDRIAVW